MSKQTYEYDGFAEAIDFAKSLGWDADAVEADMLRELCSASDIPLCGWEELPEHLQCRSTDDMEELALDFIRSEGYFIEGIDDEEE
jgi:hypothetical protein